MGNHFFHGRGPLKGQGRVKICHQSGSGAGSSLPPPLPTPPPPKKSKKNKQQVICEVHNLGHEEFLICEIRSSVLSVKRREQHTEISKCRMSFFFFFFWREGTDKKKKLNGETLKTIHELD